MPERTVASPRGPYLGAVRGAFPFAERDGDLASCCLHRWRARDVLPERVPTHWILLAANGVGSRPRCQSRLYSIWAALVGAQVVAIEAQQGFGPEIGRLAAHNGVGDRVHVEIALAGGTVRAGAMAGVVADDKRWATTSHGRYNGRRRVGPAGHVGLPDRPDRIDE